MDEDADKEVNDQEPTQSWLEKIATNIFMPHSSKGFSDFVNICLKKGALDKKSSDMIKGVIKITNSQVRDIMISRSQMATINLGMESEEMLSTITKTLHTRFPVFSKNSKDVHGIVHTKDLLKIIVNNKDFRVDQIVSILRPPTFVPESKKLDVLLKDFKSNHNHLAVVVDEYGIISGLVTIEDILEEIVGDIEDEFDEEIKTIKKIDEFNYSVEALTSIENFNKFFESKIQDSEVDTIGGLIINKLNYLPKVGENLYFSDLKFTVVEADNRRVNKVNITIKEDKKD